MSDETSNPQPDINDPPSDQRPSGIGKAGFLTATWGVLVMVLLVAGLFLNVVPFGSFLIVFLAFPVLQLVALVLGIRGWGIRWQGKAAVALAGLALSIWGWVVFQVSTTPLRLF